MSQTTVIRPPKSVILHLICRCLKSALLISFCYTLHNRCSQILKICFLTLIWSAQPFILLHTSGLRNILNCNPIKHNTTIDCLGGKSDLSDHKKLWKYPKLLWVISGSYSTSMKIRLLLVYKHCFFRLIVLLWNFSAVNSSTIFFDQTFALIISKPHIIWPASYSIYH